MSRAYVGLGANLGDRSSSLAAARKALAATANVTVVAESTVRETTPWGPISQGDYLNQVVAVETTLAPTDLLAQLLQIEHSLGRDRSDEVRYGPRVIDLDLLLYDDEVIDTPELEVPHPRIAERRFVLEPLVELDPELAVPGRGRAAGLLECLDSDA